MSRKVYEGKEAGGGDDPQEPLAEDAVAAKERHTLLLRMVSDGALEPQLLSSLMFRY